VRKLTRASLRAFIRAADERLNEYLERLDHGDVEDGATRGRARTNNLAEKIAALGEKRGRYQAMLAQLERTGEDQISLTDPDSRAMTAHTEVGVDYTIQVAVDAKNKLIVEQAAHNRSSDLTTHVRRRKWANSNICDRRETEVRSGGGTAIGRAAAIQVGRIPKFRVGLLHLCVRSRCNESFNQCWPLRSCLGRRRPPALKASWSNAVSNGSLRNRQERRIARPGLSS
jgi:hypothetical protein